MKRIILIIVLLYIVNFLYGLDRTIPNPAELVFPADGSTTAPVPSTLRWSSGGGDIEGYKLFLGTTNPPSFLSDMQMNTSYTAALNCSTMYYWQIVPYNSMNGDAVNCPVWSFTTQAKPAVSTFPWLTDFGTDNYVPFPFEDWTLHSGVLADSTILTDPDYDGRWYRYWWLNEQPMNYSSRFPLYHGWEGWMITPWINIPSAYYQLSFDVALVARDTSLPPDPSGWDDVFAVLASGDDTWGTSNILRKWDNTGSTYVMNNLGNYATHVTIQLGASGMKRFAFYAGSLYTNSYNHLFIDNIEIRLDPGLPVLSVNPPVLDFEMGIQFDTGHIIDINLSNDGVDTLKIDASNISVTGEDSLCFYADESVLPFTLTNGQSAVLPVHFNPDSEGPKTATLSIVNDRGSQTVDIPLNGEALPHPSVAIGNGSETLLNLPIELGSGFSYSQTILLQSEIDQSGSQIEKLWFYWDSHQLGYRSQEWCVYMGHTLKTNFDNGDDWMPATSLTKVYEGRVDLIAEPGWICVTLDTPFIYNNSSNLVIATEENESLYLGFGEGFRGTAVSSDRSIVYGASDFNPGPEDLYTGTLYNMIPNVMLTFGDAATEPIMQLSVNEIDFYSQESGFASGPLKLVYARNVGGGTLIFDSAQMSMQGADADQFTFYGDGSILLQNDQWASFLLRFVPQSEGSKSAYLIVPGAAVADTLSLYGESYLPGTFYENFEGAVFPPDGWERSDEQWLQSAACVYPELVLTGDYSALSSMALDYPESHLTTPAIHLESGSNTFSYVLKGLNNNAWYGASSLTLQYRRADSSEWQQLGDGIWFYYNETERFVCHDISTLSEGYYLFRFSVISDYWYDDSGNYESAVIIDEVRCSGVLVNFFLEINRTEAYLNCGAEDIIPIELTSAGGEWTAACSESWLHISALSGTASDTLAISADANPGMSSRTATITFSNGVTPDRICSVEQSGLRGNALSFDGIDDFVNAQNPSGGITDTFSISAWVKWQPSATNQIGFICANQTEQMEIHTGATDNNLRFIPTTGVYLDAGPVFPVDTLVHIVCSYSAATAEAHIWVNGAEQSFVNNGTNPLGTPLALNINTFYLGRRADGSYYYQGCLDEFSIWNTVLTSPQIQSLMTAPPDLNSIGLVQYYSFNHGIPEADNTGITQLVDYKNGMDGTLNNFTLTGSISNWVRSGAMVLATLSAPDLRIEGEGLLTWDPVPGADYYKVYRAVTPDGAFELIADTYENSLQINYSELEKAFYQVKAITDWSGK